MGAAFSFILPATVPLQFESLSLGANISQADQHNVCGNFQIQAQVRSSLWEKIFLDWSKSRKKGKPEIPLIGGYVNKFCSYR